MTDFLDDLERAIARWHGIALPNATAALLAAQLSETIEAYAALRTAPELEADPTDFAATLQHLADTADPAPDLPQ